jgi:pyruvate formate lyase activating enzyme
MHLPRFFSSLSEQDPLRCGLCPHRCSLPSGSAGFCGVRFNQDGEGNLPYYGHISALARDPIEKKPLYHYRPGSEILSVGFSGCNLRCPFCQNWRISQNAGAPGRRFSPAELTAIARAEAVPQIAYTYSEPLVHIEFLLDCMKAAREEGIANILVSNGCVSAGAAGEVLALTDAANIDLKCFSGETYARILGGDLETVLNFMSMAVEKGVHLEVTTLVVPGLNDREEELDRCADFIAGLSKLPPESTGLPEVPWHLSAYHPDWKWNAPATRPEALARTARRARKKLAFVYTGNVAGEQNETACPRCGAVLVSRLGYSVDIKGLSLEEDGETRRYYCSACGEKAPVRY